MFIHFIKNYSDGLTPLLIPTHTSHLNKKFLISQNGRTHKNVVFIIFISYYRNISYTFPNSTIGHLSISIRVSTININLLDPSSIWRKSDLTFFCFVWNLKKKKFRNNVNNIKNYLKLCIETWNQRRKKIIKETKSMARNKELDNTLVHFVVRETHTTRWKVIFFWQNDRCY